LQAIQQANVDIIREPIDGIRAEGIMTSDGVLHELDAIICATGFDTSFSARYDIIGRNQRSLKDLWSKTTPEAYLGLAISGYPNYFSKLF
jgi:hydroxyversicolorone monooxygenase